MKSYRTIVIILAAAAAFVSCGKKTEAPFLTQNEIEAHLRFISDDLLEGRGMGSRGLSIAALYQENYFRALGLEPFFESGFRQPFDVQITRPDPDAELQFFEGGEMPELRFGKDFVIGSEREDCPQGVEGEVVYCGYLIQAPERNWDDIKGMDLRGKVLLVEINEPGNFPGGEFDGEDMTYYGRWIYKFEKASELGATGILIIHNTKGAAYGWEVVRNSWSKQDAFLEDKRSRLFFQGWISGEAAEKALSRAGWDRRELAERAESRSFEPVALGISSRVRQRPEFDSIEAENIAAVVRGRHPQKHDRTIILSAHYDHLGRDSALSGDQIYNGALDNGSAVALLLSLARYYAGHAEELKMDLVFTAVTAEESGLLGSDYFARHLPLPPSKVMANLNLEMTGVWGETEDVYAIGGRHSELDGVCRRAAEIMKLEYIPERDGELGYFYRSDQLSFARAGIPAVWLHEGITSRGEDKEYIRRKHEEYRQKFYHKVDDEIAPDWDYSGTIQIGRWAREIINLLGEMEKNPDFFPESSFRRK